MCGCLTLSCRQEQIRTMRELKRLHFYRPGPKMSLQPGVERSTAEPNLPELKTGEITLLADEERCVCACVTQAQAFLHTCCTGALWPAVSQCLLLGQPGCSHKCSAYVLTPLTSCVSHRPLCPSLTCCVPQ